MTWDKESVERLLLDRPKGKDEEDRDEYDDLYHEMRRRLAIERALRDDTIAAGKGNKRRISKERPPQPLKWLDV